MDVCEWICVCVCLRVWEKCSITIVGVAHPGLGFAGTTSRGSGGFEWNLQNAVTERVAIERLDGYESFVVVGHGDETETLALVGLQVANDFDALDSAKGTEKLPEDALFRVGCQIVNENAPTCPFIKFEVNICEFLIGFIHYGT